MIFQRALQREMVNAAGASFTVLFSVTVTWTLIKILGQAAGGQVASSDVVALIAFTVLNYLPTLIILTSFISVLVAVTRSYRDSEMVVWFASGQSLLRWIWPVMALAIPLVLITGFLSFAATPWAQQKETEFTERFNKREDLKRVAPGQFRESVSSNRVFFVEGSGGSANTVVQNVFVNSTENNASSIVVAKQGVVEADAKGGQYMVLKNGRRYQGTPGLPDFQSMEFERYSMRVATKMPVAGPGLSVGSMSTPALLAAPSHETLAELYYRMSPPIMVVVLMLLAVPLGFVNPRAGSSANLILALLIFFTYSNLTKVTEASIKQGKVAFGLMWWPLHLVALLAALLLFAWRLNVNHRYHPLVLINKLKRHRFLGKAGAAPQAGKQSKAEAEIE